MSQPTKRKLKPTTILIGTFILAFLMGIIMGRLRDSPTGFSTELILISILVFFVLGLGSCIWYWRRLDETAKEAHKFSWFWGGQLGLFPGILVALAIDQDLFSTGNILNFYSENIDTSSAFFYGATTVFLFQIIGYSLVWVFWWLRMR